MPTVHTLIQKARPILNEDTVGQIKAQGHLPQTLCKVNHTDDIKANPYL